MTFDQVLAQVLDLLQREGRGSYRALKRRFDLDDGYLEDLKAEIIQAKRPAMDEDGVVLVWLGAPTMASASVREAMTSSEQQGDTALPPGRPGPGRDRRGAEHRQLTVQFCGLVASMVLAGQVDPEDWREVVRAYQAACAEVIQRFEGISRSITATGCWSTLAILLPMKMMPSGPCTWVSGPCRSWND
jgi:hypothetical protein